MVHQPTLAWLPIPITHRPHVSLARFLLCWWRHNRLLMTSQRQDNCDVITWIVISNSLDIDYIHGDIHGQLCKNVGLCWAGETWLAFTIWMAWCKTVVTLVHWQWSYYRLMFSSGDLTGVCDMNELILDCGNSSALAMELLQAYVQLRRPDWSLWYEWINIRLR